jgi:hypothetical protein
MDPLWTPYGPSMDHLSVVGSHDFGEELEEFCEHVMARVEAGAVSAYSPLIVPSQSPHSPLIVPSQYPYLPANLPYLPLPT